MLYKDKYCFGGVSIFLLVHFHFVTKKKPSDNKTNNVREDFFLKQKKN